MSMPKVLTIKIFNFKGMIAYEPLESVTIWNDQQLWWY